MRQMIVCLTTLLMLRPVAANAWGPQGHQVAARLAARHLTPTAQERVAELLEVDNNPQAVADALAVAATWADEVRKDTATESWHFLNLAWQDGRTDMIQRCENDDCVDGARAAF